MSDSTEFPSLRIRLPGTCIACGKSYGSELEMQRLSPRSRNTFLTKKSFDEYHVELGKVKGCYLGKLVCQNTQCFNKVKK